MENGLRLFGVAVNIVIVCSLIMAGVSAWHYFKTANNANNKNLKELNEEFSSAGLDRYNGVSLTGAEVINAVNKYKDDYQIKIKTRNNQTHYYGQQDYPAVVLTDSIELQNTSSNAFVNPTHVYYASLYKGNNVVGIYFCIKT